jgi:hypothetical protein
MRIVFTRALLVAGVAAALSGCETYAGYYAPSYDGGYGSYSGYSSSSYDDDDYYSPSPSYGGDNITREREGRARREREQRRIDREREHAARDRALREQDQDRRAAQVREQRERQEQERRNALARESHERAGREKENRDEAAAGDERKKTGEELSRGISGLFSGKK